MQRSVHIVFIKQLSQWMIYGKFVDIYGEFFIQQIENTKNITGTSEKCITSEFRETSAMDAGTSGASNDLWMYGICYEMLPKYFTGEWAEKVLFVGQMVVMFNMDPNEFRKKTNVWNQNKNEMVRIQKGTLWSNQEQNYFNKFDEIYEGVKLHIGKYEHVIDDIKNYVSERLSEIAISHADLLKQLQLIKDFYLLGRGELFLEFIKQTKTVLSLSSCIDETVSRDITKAFEAAAHVINVGADDLEQFSLSLPLDNVDNSMDEYQCFIPFVILKYRVKWPLHLLFSPSVMYGYNLMFRFLLRIKKIQYHLHMVWCEHREKKINKTSHLMQMRNKFMFLVDNLQYYLQVDVLEGQFAILLNAVQNSKSFEHIQRAHIVFQANVLSLCFLLPVTISSMTASMHYHNINKTGDLTQGNENPVLTILNKIMVQIMGFCKLSAACSNPLSEQEIQQLNDCDHLFSRYVDDLIKLLIGLKAGNITNFSV